MTKNRDTARRLWLNIHLVIGLSVGLLSALIGASGAVLVWRDQIDGLLHPARYAVTAGPSALAPSAYVASARLALGSGFQEVAVRYPANDSAPVTVTMRDGARGSAGPQLMTAYIDPPTGRVLDTADARASFLGILHRFHENLTIPEYNGRAIVGWIGVAMLISALTGLWVWWPRHGGLARGFRWRRGPGPSSNLHHRIGIFVALPLVAVSLTGIYIAFPQQSREFLSAIVPMSAQGQRPRGDNAPMQRSRLTIDAALDAALKVLPGASPLAINLPTRGAPEWRIQLLPRDATEPMFVAVVDATGEVKQSGSQPLTGDRIAQWIRWTHEGSHLSLVWKLAVFACGVSPPIFFVTGIMIWWRRRRLRVAPKTAVAVPEPQGAS